MTSSSYYRRRICFFVFTILCFAVLTLGMGVPTLAQGCPDCMSSAQMGQNGPLSKRHLGPLLVWLD